MDTVDLQEAARMLHRSEKTLRRWILKTKTLPAQLVHGRYRIAISDIERLAATLPSDDEHIHQLEQRLGELEARIAVMERLYELEHQKPTPPRKTPLRPAQAQTQGTEGDTLPAGYVPIYDLIKAHGLERRRNAIMRYMVKYGHLKTGHWRVGGHEVKNALDPEGVKEFMESFVTQAPRS